MNTAAAGDGFTYKLPVLSNDVNGENATVALMMLWYVKRA